MVEASVSGVNSFIYASGVQISQGLTQNTTLHKGSGG